MPAVSSVIAGFPGLARRFPILLLMLVASFAEAMAQPDVSTPLPPPPAAIEFELRGVRFEGDRTLPEEGLDAVVAPFLGQWVTLADLEELRYRLTKFYVDQGYINSGVVLVSGQRIQDGVVRFRIVAGRLTSIRVQGQEGLRPDYILGRLQPDPEAPFNQGELQERFQLLLQDPMIERLNGSLVPGDRAGSARLDLDVTRARPWEFYLRTDNARPPSTGSERVYAGGVLRNLTGYGDALDFYVGRGYRGQGREGALGWSLPLNARDTRAFLRYSRSDASLLQEPLAELDIESETQRAEVGLSSPLWRDLDGSLELGVLLSWAENKTRLLGERFSFSPGAVDGLTRSTALRLSQEWIRRDEDSAYALRSVLSFGVDILDATMHGSGIPDGRFFTWLGQAQAVWRLGSGGTRLILRGALQLAGDRLLPLEQFAVGGVESVRGYRENEQVGDEGYSLSLELRYPLWESLDSAATHQVLQLALFTDCGSAWNHGERTQREDLYSIGAGLLWTLSDRLDAELYYGYPLSSRVDNQDWDLQDEGIHFMVKAEF